MRYFDEWILYILLGLNILLWLALQTMTPGLVGSIGDRIFVGGAKINSLIAGGELWRLISAGFLHQNIFHIFSNMYSLYIIWNYLREYTSQYRLLVIYLVSIIGGNLVSFWFSSSVSIGASGGVFGLMAACVVVALVTKQRAQLQNLFQVIAINAFIGIVGIQYIDNFAHLGGFLAGGVVSYVIINHLHKTRYTDNLY